MRPERLIFVIGAMFAVWFGFFYWVGSVEALFVGGGR